MTRKTLNLLLAILMVFTILPSSALALNGDDGAPEEVLLSTVPGEPVEIDTATVESLEEGVYSVPVNFYASTVVGSGTFDIYSKRGLGSGDQVIQFNKRALVKPVGDGYEVTMLYNSQGVYDMIQIVEPDKLDDVAALLNPSSAYTDFRYMPMGDFNCPDYIKNDKLPGGGSGKNAIPNEAAYILESFNDYYRKDVEISTASEALKTGYLKFTVPNLTAPVLIKAYSRILSQSLMLPSIQPNGLICFFDPNMAIKLPDSLVPDPGVSEMGFAWTNTKAQNNPNSIGSMDIPNMVQNTTIDILDGAASVHVTQDGKVEASFTLKKDDPVVRISRVDVRTFDFNAANTVKTNYWVDAYGHSTYEDIPITDGTFTLTYDDLAFGIPLRVLTQSRYDANPSNPVYQFGWLRLDPAAVTEEEQTDHGVTLSYMSNAIPGNSVFAAPKYTAFDDLRQEYITKDRFDGYTAFAKVGEDGAHYSFFSVSLTSGGLTVAPQENVTLRFPVPAGWDIDRVTLYRFGDLSSYNLNFDVDRDGRTISVTTKKEKEINADYFLLEKGRPDDLSQVITEDGIYSATVFSKNANMDDVSMSASVIKDGVGYVEVKGGEKTLYLSIQRTGIGDIAGWLRRAFAFDNGHNQTEAEYLEYHTTEDGSLDVNGYAEYFDDFTYPKRIALPLIEADQNGYYRIGFNIPVMDTLSGQPWGDGYRISAEALLMIHNVQKIDGENPFSVYDKTVIRAKLDTANRLKSTLDGDALSALTAAIEAAQSVYEADSPSSDTIKAARDALADAIELAKQAPEEEPEPGDALADAISAAEALLTGGEGYEPASYAALQKAVTAARAARGLTEAQTAAQIAALEAAAAALVSESDLTSELEDREYSLAGKTRLWNYTQNQASMGDGAIDHSLSKLMVTENGTKAEIRLFFGPLTISPSMTGYLKSISKLVNPVVNQGVLESYDLIPATVYSWHDVKDIYNQNEDWKYPHELGFEVTIGEEYTNVLVNVPIMDELGAGNQPARLKIDWGGFALGDPVDTSALETTITRGNAITADGYTAKSYAALTAGVAAGEALLNLTGATQAMVDSRAAALDALIAALLEDDGRPTVIETVPVVLQPDVTGGKATAAADSGSMSTALGQARTALENAGAEGTDVAEIKVVAKAAAGGSGITESEVSIPAAAIGDIASNGNIVLTIESDAAVITLDHKALEKITADAGDETTIKITASKVDAGELTEQQQSVVGNSPVFALKIKAGENAIGSFGEGAATVSLPYTPKPGEDTSKLDVYYLDESGGITRMENVTYGNGFITFTTPHFSIFFISGEAEQPGGGDPTNPGGGPGTNPGENPGPGGTVDPSQPGKYRVDVDLWNASLNQESMGNVAFKNDQALVVTANGSSVLQVATRPVEVSGYTTAISSVEYDTGSGYRAARVLKSGKFTTNTKYDGTTHQVTYPKVFEIDLKNTTDTYVKVRIKVPYTPMDSLVADGSGWINARLKIAWGSVSKAPDSAELNPPSSVSSGSSSLDDKPRTPAADITDKATGVRLVAGEGVIPEGAALKVAEITSGDAYAKAQAALADITGKFKLFDITLSSGGSEVQPNGTMTLRFPIPDGSDRNNVALYRINNDGTVTLIKGNVSGNEYVADISHLSLYALAETTKPIAFADRFTDTANHWAKDAISFVVEKGFFNGTSDTTFSPDTPMTRGMFVTILGRMHGVDTAKYRTVSFTDVDAAQYYAPYVEWAIENGIVKGVGGNRFAPDSAVTREQAAAILANYRTFAGPTEKESAAGTPENGVYTIKAEALKETGDEYSMANQFFTEKGRITVAGDKLTLSITWHATQHITMDMIKELKYFTADGRLADVNRTIAADGSSMTVNLPLESLDKATVLQVYVPDGMGEMRPNFRLVLKSDTLEKAALGFADSGQISSWARAGVDAMQLAGVFVGDGSNSFNPKRPITRAEAAMIFARNLGFAG